MGHQICFDYLKDHVRLESDNLKNLDRLINPLATGHKGPVLSLGVILIPESGRPVL